MADESVHLHLPYILANQAQKHVTHNEAIRLLDALVQLAVIDRDLSAPPSSPADGDRYIVASGGSGAWDGWDLSIAYYVDGAWMKLVQQVGWRVWIADESLLAVWNGNAWVDAGMTAEALGNGSLSVLGINTAGDATNRLAVKSDAALFSHDDVTPGTGDIRLAVNKGAADKDAGFVFQTGFSTRALFGLFGDDDWTVKVSPDGSTFHTGIVIDKDNGAVALTRHPKFSGYVNYAQYNAAGAWFKIDINNNRHNDQGALSGGTFTAFHDGYYMVGGAYIFQLNASPPSSIWIGISVNGAAPLPDRIGIQRANISTNDWVDVSALLKLSAGDTVELWAQFIGNDGYIAANSGVFWGYQVP